MIAWCEMCCFGLYGFFLGASALAKLFKSEEFKLIHSKLAVTVFQFILFCVLPIGVYESISNNSYIEGLLRLFLFAFVVYSFVKIYFSDEKDFK